MAFEKRHRMHWGYASALISIAGLIDFIQAFFGILFYTLIEVPLIGEGLGTFFFNFSLIIGIGGVLLITLILHLIGASRSELNWFILPCLVFEVAPITSLAPALTPIVIRVIYLVRANDRIYNMSHGNAIPTSLRSAPRNRSVRDPGPTPDNSNSDESADWE